MASKGFSEASSSYNPKSKYEVLISFRGEDTRNNFTDHLYTALICAGVNTFRDNDVLPRGKDISSELLKAIQDSKISIVVFSKNYAFSRWCLNELVKIIECKNTIGQIIVPIFYNIDPSEVRNQSGNYAEAFAEHEQRFKENIEITKGWRIALTEAANISGWDLQNVANGHESKFIRNIVDDVLRKVNRAYMHVATHPVAMEPRIRKVMEILRMGSDEVRIVGIYGMGGIGKTTIAKAVHNFVCYRFEGSSFISDVKDISNQPNGLAIIQQQLLCDILDWKKNMINNVDRGINMIKERLCCRRAFIVLDDVDDSTQLSSLVGDRNWFGVGSRIVITTRDERLLTELEVDGKYNVEALNAEESIQLFSWHAFRRPDPKNEYMQLSMNVVAHVQGLPLALVVLGSYLFKRSHLEWESIVENLRKLPHGHIYRKLRISFDTLDDNSKAIFLDIACFFNGMDKDYVMKILDGCGFIPVIGVSVLLERSLITIDQFHNNLKMHHLLQDMGREIVREMSPNDIHKRSRLWFHQDVVDILTKHTGSKSIEGLTFDASAREGAIVSSTKAFAKMINLRLLKINSVRFAIKCYKNFSKELRWLCWHSCPLQVLPPDLHLNNLSVLDMRFSKVRQVWKETKVLHNLKILYLSYSSYLRETPNFAKLSGLERLEFEGCTSLMKVHKSIGQLERLVFLNLAECNKLVEIPNNICNVKSLNTLNLNGCSKLKKLPDNLGNLKDLTTLLANGCAFVHLPNSIGSLKNLECLSLAGCKDELPSKSMFLFFSLHISPRKPCSLALLLPETFTHLSSLQKLNLNNRNLSDNDISIDFRSFQFLRVLDIGGNKFHSLPVGISNHPRLKELHINDCTNLQSIPDLPLKLRYLEAQQCTSIHNYPNLFSIGAKIMQLKITNCHKTMDNWDLQHRLLLNPPRRAFGAGHSDLKGSYWFKFRHFEAFIPSREVPDWFDYKEMGSSVLFCVPSLSLSAGKSRAMIVCFVYCMVPGEYNRRSTECDSLTFHFRNKSKGYEFFDKPYPEFPSTNIGQDHTYICYLTHEVFKGIEIDEGDEMEVEIAPKAQGRIVVKECGIHLPIHQYG